MHGHTPNLTRDRIQSPHAANPCTHAANPPGPPNTLARCLPRAHNLTLNSVATRPHRPPEPLSRGQARNRSGPRP